MVGITSGTFRGDDIQLVGLFELDHPEYYFLEITRFLVDAPFDIWVQDGDQFTHYHLKTWDAIPISTLKPTPGQLVCVSWDEISPDLNGDGIPDMAIRRKIDGEIIELLYSEDDKGLYTVD